MNEKDPQNFDHTDLDRLHAAVKREKPEVQPGREPLPLWIYVSTWVVMILAGAYLGQGTLQAGFDLKNNNPWIGRKPVDPRPVAHQDDGPVDAFALAMKKGASVFNNCQGCHQATGLGLPGVNPPLAGSDWVKGGTERTARVVLRGLMGPVVVSGATFNNVMPPHAHLSDAEIAAVLTYIRNTWGNEGSMLTKEMVAKVRDQIADHPGPWKTEELEAFKDKNIPGDIPAGPGATAAPATGAAAPAPAK